MNALHDDPIGDGRSCFDPMIGRWRVSHRRLRVRLAGADDWDEFAGTSETRAILGGLGNVEDNFLELPGGAYRAAAIRTFDMATRQWSIWWIDGRNPTEVGVPVRGGFENGVGTFVCDDAYEGRPIKVRFVWSGIGGDSPHWRQAFSADAGATWETNWDMRFTRMA